MWRQGQILHFLKRCSFYKMFFYCSSLNSSSLNWWATLACSVPDTTPGLLSSLCRWHETSLPLITASVITICYLETQCSVLCKWCHPVDPVCVLWKSIPMFSFLLIQAWRVPHYLFVRLSESRLKTLPQGWTLPRADSLKLNGNPSPRSFWPTNSE